MFKKTGNTEKPKTENRSWIRIYESLDLHKWTHKGLSGVCPSCRRPPSRPGEDTKFDIVFEGDFFAYYNCFKCGFRGKGFHGLKTLIELLGLKGTISVTDMFGMIGGEGKGRSAGVGAVLDFGMDGDREESVNKDGGEIDWPPAWIDQSRELFNRGLAYLEKRGIKPALEFVKHYELVFSSVVPTSSSESEQYIVEFPSVIAPHVDSKGRVIGWTARRIDDGEPKARTMPGNVWKNKSLFGLDKINPEHPIAIVEGLFSALSTPNSVALGGKNVSRDQLVALASRGKELGSRRAYIFMLDPEVPIEKYREKMQMLDELTDGAMVGAVAWEDFPGDFLRDPNDRGREEMTMIFKTTYRSMVERKKKKKTKMSSKYAKMERSVMDKNYDPMLDAVNLHGDESE